ncbi:hypothetical protein [Clostridium gasigenes]|uniref:hypothetical protein n=1 Tax=Clostridium gasigenes TaxID=94869 RepID=UPI001C0D5818|nr:hypothetical protein [Clostridium gasigenes]MBU3104594.1 hypothetical protein [Clostridium gasigenes]
MKKIILSLTLIGALAMTPSVICSTNIDNPNDNVQYKKTSIEENTETSILVEDTLESKCHCEDEDCQKENKKIENIDKQN